MSPQCKKRLNDRETDENTLGSYEGAGDEGITSGILVNLYNYGPVCGLLLESLNHRSPGSDEPLSVVHKHTMKEATSNRTVNTFEMTSASNNDQNTLLKMRPFLLLLSMIN